MEKIRFAISLFVANIEEERIKQYWIWALAEANSFSIQKSWTPTTTTSWKWKKTGFFYFEKVSTSSMHLIIQEHFFSVLERPFPVSERPFLI